ACDAASSAAPWAPRTRRRWRDTAPVSGTGRGTPGPDDRRGRVSAPPGSARRAAGSGRRPRPPPPPRGEAARSRGGSWRPPSALLGRRRGGRPDAPDLDDRLLVLGAVEMDLAPVVDHVAAGGDGHRALGIERLAGAHPPRPGQDGEEAVV